MLIHTRRVNTLAPVNDGAPDKSMHAKIYPSLDYTFNMNTIKDIMGFADYKSMKPYEYSKAVYEILSASGAHSVIRFLDGEEIWVQESPAQLRLTIEKSQQAYSYSTMSHILKDTRS
jgi:hypothetical protein